MNKEQLNKIKWYSGAGEEHYFEDILSDIRQSKLDDDSIELHIGTDSDPNGKKYAIATGIVLRIPGNGGRYYWTRSYLHPEKYSSLGKRLEYEATQSIMIADALRNIIGSAIDIVVHVDCSENPAHASQKYIKQLKSYATGMGFKVKVKPDSWAASSIADKHAKFSGLPLD